MVRVDGRLVEVCCMRQEEMSEQLCDVNSDMFLGGDLYDIAHWSLVARDMPLFDRLLQASPHSQHRHRCDNTIANLTPSNCFLSRDKKAPAILILVLVTNCF